LRHAPIDKGWTPSYVSAELAGPPTGHWVAPCISPNRALEWGDRDRPLCSPGLRKGLARISFYAFADWASAGSFKLGSPAWPDWEE